MVVDDKQNAQLSAQSIDQEADDIDEEELSEDIKSSLGEKKGSFFLKSKTLKFMRVFREHCILLAKKMGIF